MKTLVNKAPLVKTLMVKTMNNFVFLGPTLSANEARNIINAEFLPPVAMGDVYNLVKDKAKAGDNIIIIDGVFEQVPAVWHKEILYAIQQGIHVYGASSMGALRSAELHTFGMQGYGLIFNWFKDGLIEDDDEVAVAHTFEDGGYRVLSEAMVNIRYTADLMQVEGIINATEKKALITTSKELFYIERSWGNILSILQGKFDQKLLSEIKGFIRTNEVNLKKIDALKLLRQFEQDTFPTEYATQPNFVLEETSFWVGLTQTASQRHLSHSNQQDNDHLQLKTRLHLQSNYQSWRKLTQKALLKVFTDVLDQSLEVSQSEIYKQFLEFSSAQRFQSHSDLKHWLKERQLNYDDLMKEMKHQAKLNLFESQSRTRLFKYAIMESKLDGSYQEAQSYTEKMNQHLLSKGIRKPSFDVAGVSPDELQQWFESKTGDKLNFNERRLQKHGFESSRELINEIISQYIFESELKEVS